MITINIAFVTTEHEFRREKKKPTKLHSNFEKINIFNGAKLKALFAFY